MPADAGERREEATEDGSSEPEKPTMPTNGNPAGPDEELPYSIELWGVDSIERLLARAFDAALAQAIFNAARNEHPGRRITLRHALRIVADTAADSR
jgi:hypothetical protein